MRVTVVILACYILTVFRYIDAKRGDPSNGTKWEIKHNKVESLRRALSNMEKDPNELISGGINSLVRKEKKVSSNKARGSKDDDDKDLAPRTATGGIINTLLVFLCFVAFLGNAIFLYHVFFGKEKVVPLKLVETHDHRL